MVSYLVMVLLLGTSAEPAQAAAVSPAPAGDTATDPEKSRIKCKSYRPSGTRFDKRVCRTVADWDRHREEAREAMREIQTKPQICVHGPCAGG